MNRSIVRPSAIEGAKVVLAKPQTYMNDSGSSVGPIAKYYKAELPDVLVIYDELDIPLAQLRMRPFGGTGGHNGMRSITERLGSQDFPRIRVGIGHPAGRMDPKDYVLQPFNAPELELMAEAYDRAVKGIELWLTLGIDRAMNAVNIRHNFPEHSPITSTSGRMTRARRGDTHHAEPGLTPGQEELS